MDRFFCPNLADAGRVTIDGAESTHLTRVLRHDVGDVVELFDGQGRSSSARLIDVSKRAAVLERTDEMRHDAPPEVSLTLGVAPPKGERLRWLIEKATELGVAAFVPLQCERSVVEPRETKLLKLEQTVIAACKQSGRNRLMEIRPPESLRTFLSPDDVSRGWIADPTGCSFAECLAERRVSGSRVLRCAIGPEGGFTTSELASAVHLGARPVSLGGHVLRVETAAIAIAAVIQVSSCELPESRRPQPPR
jgi:16S rRNA (uracil1498-N3)-methyltransferase